MPIDAYSLCPGGTGKKIKFCCPDLLPELEKIVRMTEGDQTLAALNHVEHVLEKQPDRACLLALRAELLRSAGRVDDLASHAAHFVEAHPENQLAWAESAIAAAVGGDVRCAIDCIYRSMEYVDEQLYPATYDAMRIVAQAAVAHRAWGPALALLRLQSSVNSSAQAPRNAIAELQSHRDIPILLRSVTEKNVIDEAPWAERLREVLLLVFKGRFHSAEEKLAVLVADTPGEPVLWQWLTEIRSALFDTQGEIVALCHLASLDISWDEAVEAKARAMLIADDPLGDGIDMLRMVWAVEDGEQLETAIRLDPRTFVVPNERVERDDDNPPPRVTFILLDRPTPTGADEITPQTLSRPWAQARLFGKQTDREAQLEVVGFVADQRADIESQVAELAGGKLSKIIDQEALGRASRSVDLVEAEFAHPEGADPEVVQTAVRQFQREAILDRWPDLSLGVLGGRTPREVADSGPDESQRRKLAAAVLTLQSLVEVTAEPEVFAELRARLGLPELGPINPEPLDIRRIPANRLDRVMAEKLGDEDLAIAFSRSGSFLHMSAMRKFALALVEREHLGAAPPRLHAIEQLAYAQDDPSKSMEYIAMGRRACEEAGQSNVMFDFAELNVEVSTGDARNIFTLIDHIQKTHFQEQGVSERLGALLIRIGILNPDGTPGPAVAAARQRGEMARDTGAVPAAVESEPGKLWTPDSEAGASGGKLWTPD